MRGVKTTLAILGLCTVTVVVAELGARAVFWAATVAGIGQTEARAHQPAFADEGLDRQAVFREMVEAQDPSYEPYTLWRHRASRGEFLNVDAQGHRVTLYGSDDPDTPTIWVLGGSAVFGYGVPDGDTIPSQLARALGEAGLPASVLNLGEDGYVSMQELIRLVYELHRRPPPDLAIVYSGFNDSKTAWAYPDRPAIHEAPERIRERFERPLLAGIRESSLYRLAEYARNTFFPGPPGIAMAEGHARDAGRWVAETWIRNVMSIEALGNELGFETLIVFQPTVDLGDKPLHPSERRSPFRTPILQGMYERVRELSASPEGPEVLDLTGVFDTLSDPVFVDPVHVSGRGNEIVGRRLARVVLGIQGRE